MIGLRVVDRVQELGVAAVEREVWSLKGVQATRAVTVATGVDASVDRLPRHPRARLTHGLS